MEPGATLLLVLAAVLVVLFLLIRSLKSNHTGEVRSEEVQNFVELNFKLCESHNDVGVDVPYRLVEDDNNVVRINQQYDVPEIGEWITADTVRGLPVAGVSYRQEDVVAFIGGERRRIELVSEYSKKFPHAIAVYGKWSNSKEENLRRQLGYVPDEDARKISNQIKSQKGYLLLGRLSMMFIPVQDKPTAGLRIDIVVLVFKKNGHS